MTSGRNQLNSGVLFPVGLCLASVEEAFSMSTTLGRQCNWSMLHETSGQG